MDGKYNDPVELFEAAAREAMREESFRVIDMLFPRPTDKPFASFLKHLIRRGCTLEMIFGAMSDERNEKL